MDRTVYLVDPWGQVFVTVDYAKTWSSLGAALRNGATILDVTMTGTAMKSLYAGTDRAAVVKFVTDAGFETATEFYHPAFDHYFVTAEPDEVKWLNLGNLPPWVPTGHTWTVWSLGTAGSLPVCRFFSAAFAPKSSHFYTPYAQECADLIREGAWQYAPVVQFARGATMSNSLIVRMNPAMLRDPRNGSEPTVRHS